MAKAQDATDKLIAMKLGAAAKLVEMKIDEMLTYHAFPSQHWLKTNTNNTMQRLLPLVSATQWGPRKYMDMELLREMDHEIRYLSA